MSSSDNNGSGLAVIMAIPIAIIVGIGLLIFLALVEIARVYAKRAIGHQTQIATILWLAGVVELVLLAAGFFLMQETATWYYGAYLASWSFLLYVLLIEVCDKYQARFDPPDLELPPLGGSLNDHLGPLDDPVAWPSSVNGAVDPAAASRW